MKAWPVGEVEAGKDGEEAGLPVEAKCDQE